MDVFSRENRRYLIRNAEACFFDAMRQGYVSEPEKTAIRQLPGSRHILVRGTNWSVTDTYFVTPHGDQSGGTTVVYCEDVPVWMMQYLGAYKANAIPFLREALSVAYKNSLWYGGRGPELHRNRHEWTYINRTSENATFRKFSGTEWVHYPDGEPAGWHSYQGLLLIDQ